MFEQLVNKTVKNRIFISYLDKEVPLAASEEYKSKQ